MDLRAGIRARVAQVVDRAIAAERASSPTDFAQQAGLGRGHVHDIINGKMEPSLKTLEKVASFGQVSLEYLIFGLEELPPRHIASEVDAHPSAAFGPAARAYLELRRYSADAEAVVRTMLRLPFNAAHEWMADEWLEELLAEDKRRARGLQRTA